MLFAASGNEEYSCLEVVVGMSGSVPLAPLFALGLYKGRYKQLKGGRFDHKMFKNEEGVVYLPVLVVDAGVCALYRTFDGREGDD